MTKEKMAGVLLNLVPKRVFDFTELALSQQKSIVIAEQIDVLQYCDGIVITRVHQISMGGGSLTLLLQPDGHIDGDSSSYVDAGTSYFSNPAILDSTIKAGTMLAMGSEQEEFNGQYAILMMTASRTVASLPLNATLSIDLLLRSPDDFAGLIPSTVAAAGGCGCDDT